MTKKITLVKSTAEIPSRFSSWSWEEKDDYFATHDFAPGVLEEGPHVDAEVREMLGLARPTKAKPTSSGGGRGGACSPRMRG